MEIEFKFRIPPERLKAVEAALRRGAVGTTRLQARYHDTADGALAAAGVALRLRKEGRRWVQTAKAAGAGPVQRLEHNADLGGGAPPALPDPARHAGTPVGERLAEVLAAAGGAPLVQTYATDVRRLTRVVRHAGATVELALDTGRIAAPGPAGGPLRTAPVCELELELLRGPVSALAALAAQWAQRHGLWLSTVSKAERGERLMRGDPPAAPVKAAPPDFAPLVAQAGEAPDGPAVQRAVVAACLAQILPNATEVAEGSEDAEVVHQLRIGIRRLRVALRELAALAPGLDPAWEAPLVETFRALGAQRDRDLVLAEALAALQADGAPAIDLPPPAEAPVRVAEVVRAPALQAALVALVGLAASPAAADAQGQAALDAEAALAHLQQRLRRLRRQVLRDGARFESLDDEARHRVRKRLKRLRYLAEFTAPLFGARRTGRFLDALRPAQDALGVYNDAVVARALFVEAVPHDARAWYALGWLDARRDALARRAHRALVRIADAPAFWKGRG